jgi:hypothetical protein
LDDDVVVHGNAEWLGDVDDRLHHLNVRTRRRRIVRRMIVHQDQRGGREFERALDHLAADLLQFVGDELVAPSRNSTRNGSLSAKAIAVRQWSTTLDQDDSTGRFFTWPRRRRLRRLGAGLAKARAAVCDGYDNAEKPRKGRSSDRRRYAFPL